jgi:hypothetical protein
MALVVTALSQTRDLTALRRSLVAAGLSLEPLKVISEDEATASLAGRAADTTILTSDLGTSVPGIGASSNRSLFHAESVTDLLGELEIPENELDNYAQALQRGKCVIAYFAKEENVERALELFRAAPGLTNVRRF